MNVKNILFVALTFLICAQNIHAMLPKTTNSLLFKYMQRTKRLTNCNQYKNTMQLNMRSITNKPDVIIKPTNKDHLPYVGMLLVTTGALLCLDYFVSDHSDKDEALRNLMKTMNSLHDYETKRLPALMLICAGADPNTEVYYIPLLERAVDYNDTLMAKVLFKHHADPNVKTSLGPIFFYTKTVKIAQLFLAQENFNVHATEHGATNVLWHITEEEYPSELMALYLQHGVNAKNLKPWDNSCVLHELAKPLCKSIDNVDDFLQKGELLLTAMPGMVNTLNNDNQTPLDIAQQSLEEAKKYDFETPEAFEKLSALFREHGGLTAQELAQNGVILPNNDAWKEYRRELMSKSREHLSTDHSVFWF